MKKRIEKTDYDCYIVIDSIRGKDRVTLCCIKESAANYHVAEDYCLYDGGVSFEDAEYLWPFVRKRNSLLITKRKYAQFVDEIEKIKKKVMSLHTGSTTVRRGSLKVGDCIRLADGYMKINKIADDGFEATGLSVNEWGARYCSHISGSISEHIPEEVVLIDEEDMIQAEGVLRCSLESLMDVIISEYRRDYDKSAVPRL